MDNNMSKKLEMINQVCDMIDDIYYQYASTFGITDTELCILYALNEHDGEYLQSDICRDWHCSLQTIHTTIKNMEKKGMITLLCQAGNKKNKRKNRHCFRGQMKKRVCCWMQCRFCQKYQTKMFTSKDK